MKPLNRTTFIATAALLSAFVITSAPAHEGATGIVKERMESMKAMGKAMGAVADMFKGKRAFDPAVAGATADLIGKHAAMIVDKFPDSDESRKSMHSEALPVIWERRADFDKLAEDLQTKAVGFGEVAASGEEAAIRAAFGKMAKVCTACHEDFRKKKQ